MSTISTSLSAGVQILANDGLLPSNLTAQQLQNASPAQLTQLSIDNVELSTVSSLFGESSSSNSANTTDNLAATLLDDSADSSTGTSDSIFQALETAATNSSTPVFTAQTTDSSADASQNTTTGNVGTLFSYLG